MRIRVKVTKNEIDAGIPRDTYSCPIGQALRKQGFSPRVLEDSFTVSRDGYLLAGNMTAAAKKFITAFDGYKKVKPFETVLTAK